jgi:predicted membrane chloride channel (bestrophin family)
MEKSSYHAAASFAAIDTHDRIVQKNTRSIVNWKLYAANHGASREYLASLSAAEAAENTANITEAAGDDHHISTNDFISSSMCAPDDIDCILAEKINGDGEDVVDEKIFLQDTMGAMAKVDEVIEDDDYASSMLFPVRSDIVNGGDNNNNNNNNSTLGGEGVSSVFINGDEEECIISSDDASNQQSPNTSSKDSATDLYTIICSSDTDKVSKFDNLDAADDDDDEKSNRATTHSLLKEGENLPDDSATYSTVGGMAVARYLRRKLSRTNENDDENEMTQEQRRQQWTQWMTTGRKSGSSSTTTTSTDISFDESLLNIDKGEDYVVVAVPADAVANNNVGVKLSSFPGGKLFQKTVANMQRELLENRNVTKVSGGSDDSKQEQQQQQQQQQQERAAKNKERKKKEKKERTDKKYKEKVEAAELEKQMKLRQQQINLEQRIREKGRVTANDWKHNMGNLFASTILRDVRDPVLCVFVWATTWSAIYKVLSKVAMGSISCKSDAFVAAAGWFTRHASLPSLPHSMMVSAMSLLLVFRTNSAYQRFVEGRKIWNDIVDTSRDFSRYVKLYEFAIGTSKVRRINALLASFPYLLRHRIRPSLIAMRRVNDPEYERDPENSLLLYPDASLRDTDPDLAALAYDGEEAGQPSRRMKRELCWVDKRTLPWKLLPGSALELCARAQNRPLWVCDRMAKELAMVDDVLPKWTNRERLALIGCVDKLSRSIGACERIHQTVVPLNYARHALRSLTVWLWTLPLVMAKDLGLMTGPVVAVVSWILFGVYEIGSRIEDPFQGTLRLSIYCDAIRRDVLTDSIARDTAFELEEESKVSMDDEGDEDAIFELDSESEEYGGDDVPLQKQMKTTKKKKSDSFLERFGL